MDCIKLTKLLYCQNCSDRRKDIKPYQKDMMIAFLCPKCKDILFFEEGDISNSFTFFEEKINGFKEK